MTDAAPHARTSTSTADAIELLGLVAYTELASFGRLAGDAAHAPTLRQRQTLSRMAASLLERQGTVLERVAELGGDPESCMATFDGLFDDFDARTRPSTWWEGILKGYVGQGVADDFCLLTAGGLDDRSRDVVVGSLTQDAPADRTAPVIAEAAAADGVLASRLALWGRRLVGEALGVVGVVLTEHPALERLVADAIAEGGVDRRASADETRSAVFAHLTAEHTRRMDRLGLAA
ncbi:ferritin-like fold-containing protein [Cellulosimicrobium marinum]|uniref:ferritin-like fold-containing protein n=1 Tax=Cellulosimicrobium marinum TaxID=1638992 RepID=UPI001E64645D|nr:ferritin-like fold-containing protein [Cellulosimicrobium marinum]MCB7136631.1 ferritin-like domain-containing protein [Cellulosimicrobium marinum]